MRKTIALTTILALVGGSVLAVDEDQLGSQLSIEKLLELTGRLQDRVGNLEDKVKQQKAEIARLEKRLQTYESVRLITPGPDGGAAVPQTPLRLTPQYAQNFPSSRTRPRCCVFHRGRGPCLVGGSRNVSTG